MKASKTFRAATIQNSYRTGKNKTSSVQAKVGQKFSASETSGTFGLVGKQLTSAAASRQVAKKREDDDKEVPESHTYLNGVKVSVNI